MSESGRLHGQKDRGTPLGDPNALETGGADLETEARAARHGAVVIDRSDRGRVRVAGRDHIDLLHRLTTNEVKELSPLRGKPHFLLTNKGRILEQFDLLLLEDAALLSLASDRASQLIESIRKFVFVEEIDVRDDTQATFELLLAGPQSREILAAATHSTTLPSDDRDHCPATLGGIDVLVGVAEPLAGQSFRVIGNRADADTTLSALATAGAQPAGTELLEILRIEAGAGAPEHEYSERFNPLEVDRVDHISFTKGCYTGQEVVARLFNYGKVQRRLMGLTIDANPALELDTPVEINGRQEGFVTSAAPRSDSIGVIALALIEREHATAGSEVVVAGLTAHLCDLPFTGSPPHTSP